MLNTTPSLTVKLSTTGHSKSSSVTSAPLTSAATAPSLPVRTASTMLKPFPTKPSGTGFGRTAVYSAVPPAKTQSQPRPSVIAANATPRSGHESPRLINVRTASASYAQPGGGPSIVVVNGYGSARASAFPKGSAPSTGSTLTVGVTRPAGSSARSVGFASRCSTICAASRQRGTGTDAVEATHGSISA